MEQNENLKLSEKEIELLFQGLTEENKNVLNMVAKGMQIAQENRKEI